MAIFEGGTSAAVADVGAVARIPAHIVACPDPYGSLGHYAFAGVTGAIAAGMAANGELFQLRWTDATRFCVVREILVTGMRTTTAFAAGVIDIKATIARVWSASGTGGTALTLTGESLQLRTSMGATLVGDARIATTAALGGGTKTPDTHDIGLITTHSSAGWNGATPIVGSTYLPTTVLFQANVNGGGHPIVLAQNEGFVVRATVPATGVWNLGVLVRWAEETAY